MNYKHTKLFIMKLTQVTELANEILNKRFAISLYGNRKKVKNISGSDLGYSFVFDNARRRAGRCHYGKKTISLSKPIVKKNLHRKSSIEDTLLHELAHAFSYAIYGRKGHGHNRYWKDVAKQIGAKPERCYTDEKFEAVKSKYTLICDSCGNESPMHRKPKNFRSRSCGDCSNTYDPKYKLRIRKNY